MWNGTFWFPVQCRWPCWMTLMDAFIFHYSVCSFGKNIVQKNADRSIMQLYASQQSSLCRIDESNDKAMSRTAMVILFMTCLHWARMILAQSSVWSYLLYLVTVVHMTGIGIKNWLWRVRKWPQICATDSQACLSARVGSNPVWFDSLWGLFEVISSAFKTVLLKLSAGFACMISSSPCPLMHTALWEVLNVCSEQNLPAKLVCVCHARYYAVWIWTSMVHPEFVSVPCRFSTLQKSYCFMWWSKSVQASICCLCNVMVHAMLSSVVRLGWWQWLTLPPCSHEPFFTLKAWCSADSDCCCRALTPAGCLG